MAADSQVEPNVSVVLDSAPSSAARPPAPVTGAAPELETASITPHVDESDPGQQFRRVFGWVALFAALIWGTFMGGFLASM